MKLFTESKTKVARQSEKQRQNYLKSNHLKKEPKENIIATLQ
jgi:hypothetical protein